MRIDGSDTLVGAGLQQLGADDLLNRKNNTILGTDSDRGASVLYCLDRIFNLEVPTVGREDGVEQVVTCSYGRLKVASWLAPDCGA